jgi:hypothetical protein
MGRTLSGLRKTQFTISVVLGTLSVAFLSAVLPSHAASASFPHLANPKQAPACTSALLSHKNLTARSVRTCLSMYGRPAVAEQCVGGAKGYLIGLRGWQGVPRAAAATWGIRTGNPAARLTALQYDPEQLKAAVCGSSSGSRSTATTDTTAANGNVAVPNVSGDSMQQAISSIQAAGLEPGGVNVDPLGPKTNNVLSTKPSSGTLVPSGSKVVFNVGRGN